MPKEPAIPPNRTSLLPPRDADAEQKIKRLTRKDRESLNAFVQNLNRGVGFDDMDGELKSWWMRRY